MESEGNGMFNLSYFDFILVGTKLVGEKTRDTLMSESLGEDWNQLPPLPQGPLGIPPSPSQDMAFLDKGSVAPPPLVKEA